MIRRKEHRPRVEAEEARRDAGTRRARARRALAPARPAPAWALGARGGALPARPPSAPLT